ncbi:partial Bifunctional uridylyltransferase/uridylyl-removing enzyme, partial [Burkholderiales bacterium]
MDAATPARTAASPGPRTTSALRDALRSGRDALRDAFLARPDTPKLLRGHARLVDQTILEVWRAAGMPGNAALVAVGGYGRGQLFPHSDVDVLILLPDEGPGVARIDSAEIERFLATLWDVGLEASHAVRTVGQCVSDMDADVTTRTSLLEHRWLAGDRALHRAFARAFDDAMDTCAFYEAKALEQQQRHLKHHDAAYNLEPNVKENPGGLRDLQTVVWIARAAGLGRTWRELARAGLMTMAEARAVSRQERLIGGLRVRLHYLAGRREDRLVFDLQAALARQLGHDDTPTRRATEQLMQRYYRAAKTVRQVNTILLQNLHARLFPIPRDPVPIDDQFCAIDELLHIASEDLFDRQPSAMLDAFLLMERHPELKGMSARTLRALWRSRHRIDAGFRRDPGNRARFLALLREPRGITHELRRMNLYGILGQYLPAFGRIVGQMQHDLFHVYTVDQHILMVLRNVRRFLIPEHAHEYPFCSQLAAQFDRPYVLYVAALFHDVAKGRGGDHSDLGAREVRHFCRDHGIEGEDAALIEFLVKGHLTMSRIAQKEDLADPDVIEAFARLVGTERRLTALYLLTVADIRGTSPKVWNAWKGKLLEDLYRLTLRALGGARPNLDAEIEARKQEARHTLNLYSMLPGTETALWKTLEISYFARHDAGDIAWHARSLYRFVNSKAPVVRARASSLGEGLQVVVYAPDRPDLFARICGYFDSASFNILDAKVHTTKAGYALDTFQVISPMLDQHHRDLISLVENQLAQALNATGPLPEPSRGRLSRRVKSFPITPRVTLRPD